MHVVYFTSRTLYRIALKFPIMASVKGREHFPKKGGFILASNHISYSDPPIVGSCAPRVVHFLAKKELFNSAWFSYLLKSSNAHPLSRGTGDLATMRLAINIINQGDGIVLFPEGTRSRNGQLGKGKPGIGMMARRGNCPIIPCYAIGQQEFIKCLTFRGKMYVHFGEAITPEWMATLPAGKEGARLIADETMARIARLKEEIELSQSPAKS